MSPGVRQTRTQIGANNEHWRGLAAAALTSGRAPLVALGDSIAQGIGAASPTDGYVGQLAVAIDPTGALPVINLSRSGARFRDVLDVQMPALAALPLTPRLVVCTVGSNDLVRSSRLRRARADLGALVEALPQNAVLATVPAAGSMVAKRFNHSIRAAAAEHDIAVADIGAELRSWKGLVARDRFHPNNAGHRLWADVFTDAIGGRAASAPT